MRQSCWISSRWRRPSSKGRRLHNKVELNDCGGGENAKPICWFPAYPSQLLCRFYGSIWAASLAFSGSKLVSSPKASSKKRAIIIKLLEERVQKTAPNLRGIWLITEGPRLTRVQIIIGLKASSFAISSSLAWKMEWKIVLEVFKKAGVVTYASASLDPEKWPRGWALKWAFYLA